MCSDNKLIPKLGVITDIWRETPDVKTFRITALNGGVPFDHMPGQCAMLSIPGVGEGMFSISTSPTNRKFMDFGIKQTGVLTEWLHGAEPGQQITIRGPLGNFFPVETDLKGKDLLIIAGGIALAPLRSVIHHVFALPQNYGKVDIVYGARSVADIVFKEEIETDWKKRPGVKVHVTIDRPEEGWDGHVGFAANFVKSLNFSPGLTTLLCGPPIMIKTVLGALDEMGFDDKKIYTTMEMRMKCGIGKCGRCNIGSKYVCKDGPVFRCDELSELPPEY